MRVFGECMLMVFEGVRHRLDWIASNFLSAYSGKGRASRRSILVPIGTSIKNGCLGKFKPADIRPRKSCHAQSRIARLMSATRSPVLSCSRRGGT
jgi:hypothetical protein